MVFQHASSRLKLCTLNYSRKVYTSIHVYMCKAHAKVLQKPAGESSNNVSYLQRKSCLQSWRKGWTHTASKVACKRKVRGTRGVGPLNCSDKVASLCQMSCASAHQSVATKLTSKNAHSLACLDKVEGTAASKGTHPSGWCSQSS